MTDDLIAALTAALGPGGLKQGDAIPARNRADALGYPATVPRALCLPADTEGVAAVLRLCHAAGAPVVVQGGMTGLAGGAHPGAGEIALSLDRLRGVEEVDTASATLTALAGTPLAEVQAAAEAAGMLCGIDLGARGSCTIGGNVATNAGGNQVLRYGMTRRNVLGLEVVQPDGTVVRNLNKMLKNNAGYDWTQLFIGSEGTLGVITRVVIGLHPRPEGIETALIAVPDMDAALALLRGLERGFGGGLLTFEGMWGDFLGIAIAHLGRPEPFALRPELAVLVEVATGPGGGGQDRLAEGLAGLMEDGTVTDARIARSGQERAALWSYRESPYDYGRLGRRMANFDVSVPRDRIGAAVAALRDLAARDWPPALQGIFGHVADSNLHVIVALGAGDPEVSAVEAAVYDVIAGFDGSISAEHGIGRSKRAYLPLSRSAPELALMRQMKAALDPRGILNPGRVLA